MANPLVIVESPAKARTIAGYLGDGYTVESSVGHIRDLPRSAKDIPAAYKAEKWSRLGVDVDNDFKPLYIVSPEKKDQVRRLKKLVAEASELYLATDEDREGEAIAWHLLEVLNPRVPVKRMVFHEITPDAIQRAIDSPRDLDRRLVDAQEVRRILDRLVGYEVSPVLWKKIMPRLSAGRVQSVATRIVVQRERDRMAFVPAGYWSIDATLVGGAGEGEISFAAALSEVDGKRVATGKDFDARGRLSKDDAIILDEAEARTIATGLAGRDFAVRSVEKKPYRRRPAAPFITSTFQQEAGRKLRMSSAQAMRAAQSLYESGFITYMRTDSTTLSQTALDAARSEISKRYGADFLPDEPRSYKKKSKNAQEAHEAIRPAGDAFRSPDEVAAEVSKIDAQVYELIWQRTVASQMNDALGETVSVKIAAQVPDGRSTLFSASGTVITHPGYQRVYVEGDDAEAADAAKAKDADRRLPPMAEGDELSASELVPSGHETQPPARFTEASLVKRLEELGVGRPSTYAATISTIIDRGYVWKKGTALVPLLTAFAVVRLLEEHFSELIDYEFTARMEDDLDLIANGETEAVPWLTKFYFGPNGKAGGENPVAPDNLGAAALGLKDLVSVNLGDIDAREISTVVIGADEDGVPIVARVGRYGPYLQHGEDTTSIAEDIPPDELTIERALELLNAPKGDKVLGVDPETKLEVFVKNGRFGPYVQLGEMPEDDGEKPKTSSLFATMDVDSISLDEALKLLQLPRTVGTDPADGVVIEALNGRYGPYIKKGTDSRSLDTEDQLFTTTLEQALALLAQPKRRGRGTPKPPLRELGDDLGGEGKPMVIKDGRFGPYVTDGEVNASLRKGDTVEDITIERASELLQIRRDNPTVKKAKKKAPAKKKKKATKKKATKKKAPAKKKAAAKKAPSKKAAAEKKAD